MSSHFLLRYVLLVFAFSSLQGIGAQQIDSLTQLVKLPANDTTRGLRYLALAQAWFWEDPTKTDSLLKISGAYLTKAQHYGGLSDVHNFRANYHYMGGRPEAACSSLDTAMQYAARAGDSLHVVGIRKNLTILRSENGDTEGALAAIDESMQFLQRRGDTSLLAEHFTQRGLLRKLQGYRLLALDDLQTALELHRAKNEVARIAEVEQRIGQLLFAEEDYETALQYYTSAAEHYQQANQQQYYAEVLTNWATTLHQLGRHYPADSLFTAAIELSKTLDQPYNVAHATLLRAESWLERGVRFAEAKNDVLTARTVFAETMPMMVGSSDFLIASIDTALAQYPAALQSVNRSIDIFKAYGEAADLETANRLKAGILQRLGQPVAALKAYKIAQSIADSLFNIQQARAVSELNIRYGTKLKDRELELNRNRISSMHAEQENMKLQNRLLLVGLLATIMLLGFGYTIYTLRKKKLEAELRYRERELAAQRLHLLHKGALLQQVEKQFSTDQNDPTTKEQRQLINSLRTQEALDQDWKTFTAYFQAVHGNFTDRLDQDFPELTITEKRLAYLLHLGTNTAEAASLLRIQPESIRKAKYRLKKKLKRTKDQDDRSLEDILRQIAA